MRFPVYFKRGKNTPGSPVLGSDTAPTVSSTHDSPTNKDCILATRVTGVGNSLQRVAVGYWYEGVGVAVTLPVSVWVWDGESGKWYQAASGTLTNGQLTYLKLPTLPPLPATQANMSKPDAGGAEVLIVVSDNTSPDGTIHIVAGSDTGQF